MASIVLKEILLLANVKLPQLALLGWGGLGAWGPSNSIAPYTIDLQPEIGHFCDLHLWELFLRAIYGDSILFTSSPRANIVKFCVHLSRTVEIAVHNYMRPRQSVYISSTFASILGCLLETLFFLF